MLDSYARSGSSSRVAMRLLVNGTTLPIAQMGPDFLLLDKTIDHPPSTATIVLAVDENERSWQVWLPEGVSAGSGRLRIATTGASR